MRKNIIDIKTNEKLSVREAARRFGISPNTVHKWCKKIEPKGWRKQRVGKIDMEKLEEDVINNPDAYQYERAKRLKVSQAAVHFGLKRLGVTYKKTLEYPKADKEKRAMFLQKIEQYKKEKMPIAYVDESGFAHSMPRTHGYSRMGKRCYGSCDWNARGRKNVIAALYESSIIGCGIIEDNIDTNVFNTWVEKILIPDLPDKSVIVMDNAAFHKSKKLKYYLKARDI